MTHRVTDGAGIAQPLDLSGHQSTAIPDEEILALAGDLASEDCPGCAATIGQNISLSGDKAALKEEVARLQAELRARDAKIIQLTGENELHRFARSGLNKEVCILNNCIREQHREMEDLRRLNGALLEGNASAQVEIYKLRELVRSYGGKLSSWDPRDPQHSS